MRLSAERTTRAMMIAGAVFYVYWTFVEPSPVGQALAVGTLFGGASFNYDPGPRPIPFVLGFAALLFAVHLWRGAPLPFAEGYLVGAGLPWLIHRFAPRHDAD
ncbi:MAG TPA: hypothetical protein ENK37_04995 [Oceanithermus profundus]|uniref:Uncharacterized protein n=1 Tax=Oceanithermus profundus TaxID=187137 RepID=A0A7C4ZGK1_9DEIN|nr:hypothetical protein [Oceanithermus profundus]